MFSRSITSISRQSLRLTSLRASVRFNSSVSHKITPGSIITQYSSTAPQVRYTAEHEYIAQHADNVSFIGITKYAADALGDATFVELPEVGDVFAKGDSIGSVESVKSSSEIYTPIDGEVIEVNTKLTDSPQLINEDPLGEGWIAKIKAEVKVEEVEDLMTEETYEMSLQDEDADGH
ncbi:hypothetical protein WICPIJ_010146 [Wickerhamomyces pijperi]|uniref:Glycine cleavage system H protein n=1 Tax=Wickerhamomyces pijperi TaxID=599730 RepID=A0A9P8PIV9_WICPI|nr:hypothetical protein WICPIJ_010146 [Wickerhamomyces pijperi]